ncbi:DUF4283 domain protein [Melia azedarach]|uniref:DUF4283 domain protein n=1 Tax=Melia azedarach TaxID=155640 RepID=A0ACC1Y837_MELAZ|nr:DUF4283 domain protein [Melia azedarach]
MASVMDEIVALLSRIQQSLAEHNQPYAPSEALLPKSNKPTFGSLLSKPNDLTLYTKELSMPVQRGELTVVRIEPDLHEEQVKLCIMNLIGRIVLRPGSKPMKLEELQNYLNKIWQPDKSWHMTPLAKGFFDIHFMDESDMRKIWGGSSCALLQGVFRLYQWQPNFNPFEQKI